jgi:hypothetical protein
MCVCVMQSRVLVLCCSVVEDSDVGHELVGLKFKCQWAHPNIG